MIFDLRAGVQVQPIMPVLKCTVLLNEVERS